MERRHDVLYDWIDRASVAEDLSRPEPTDRRVVAAAMLIRRMLIPAVYVDLKVYAWLVTEAQRLWAEHGPCAALVPSVSSACFSTIWVRGDYGVGVRIARHVLAVGEGRGYEVVTAHGRLLYAASGCHWFEPVENDIRQARVAREVLLHVGDLQATCFSYYQTVFALVDYGPTLDDLASEIETALTFADRTANKVAAAIHLVYRQFVRAMCGRTGRPGGFSDASFDTDTHLRIGQRVAAHVHIIRALSAAIFDDMEGLVRHAEAAKPYTPLVFSLYTSVPAHLVQALALAHRARTAPADRRPALLAELDTYRDWLAQRAPDAPENFQHLHRLVEAERAWAIDDFRAAAIAYDMEPVARTTGDTRVRSAG
jgi:hypothetical protein